MNHKTWALYLGCVIPNRLPYMELALRETLRHFEVPFKELAEFTCCPNPLTLSHLDHHAALAITARNLAIAEKHKLPILTPCHGCFETLKGTATLLHKDKALLEETNKILAKTKRKYNGTTEVKHLIQFLFEDIGADTIAESVINPLSNLHAAIHVGCHLLRPSDLLNVDDSQRPKLVDELVRAIGAKPIRFQDEMDCCGKGTHPVDRTLSLTMTATKLANMKRAGADALIVICPACMLQFDLLQRLALRNSDDREPLPVFYYPELLNLALGTSPNKLGFNQHRVKVDSILTRILPEQQVALLEEIRP